jgi:hypothetical protein
MKGLVIGVVALVIVAGAVLFFQNRMPSNSKTPVVTPPAQTAQLKQSVEQSVGQPASLMTVTLNLMPQNNSGEKGTATLTELEGGKTKVVLNITGQPKDMAQPAHIHVGSCANLGNVVYPLTFPTNGTSETTLDVSLKDDILNKLPMAINVHKSAADISTYVSCADISASGSPAAQTSPANPPSQAAPQPVTPPARSSAPAGSYGGY